MTTTLDSPPIRLIRCTSSTPQTPGSFPIPTSVAATQEPATDIELQESEAQTSFVFEKAETQLATHPVAETQEPATGIETPNAATQHSVAETQEPATDFEIEEIETPAAATQHLVAETQEPTTDFEMQEIETPDAATQHPVAETQEPATNIDIEIQESEVEGAETLLSLHQEAEASVAFPVAAPQTSAHEDVTAT
jgi:hypothetical protein